jgi:hypothetical protein
VIVIDEPESTQTSTQSGGIDIASNNTNIGADVVGRDKVVVYNYLTPNDATSQSAPDRLAPTNVRRALKWRLTSTSDVIEFTLASPHIVKFFFKASLANGVINLIVDGEEIFRDTFPMPMFFKSANYGFQVEGANCLLKFRMIMFMAYHRIIVEGRKL